MPRFTALLSARLSPRARRRCALAAVLVVYLVAVYVVGSLVGYVLAAGSLGALCAAATLAHRHDVLSSPLAEAGAKAVLSSFASLASWLLARVSRVLVAALLLAMLTGLGSGAIGSLLKIATVLAIAWVLLTLVVERVGQSSDDEHWFT
jgi:hypothetical protein